MGLDTTHNAWHGPYSSFMDWRIWIASKAGINLLDMEGYSDRDYSNPDRKKGHIKWNMIKDDLKYLLNHSDCDGKISAKRCKKIADRLKTIIDNTTGLENQYYYDKTVQFRKGCIEAYKNDEPIKFH